MTTLVLFTDGGSRGNPGDAAYGFVVYEMPSGDTPISDSLMPGAAIVREKCGNYLGVTTNNQAEYAGLVAGLEWIVANCPGSNVVVNMDSLLVVNQIKGLYKMKNVALQPLFAKAKGLIGKLPKCAINYVPRAQNAVADSLVNAALDKHLGLI